MFPKNFPFIIIKNQVLRQNSIIGLLEFKTSVPSIMDFKRLKSVEVVNIIDTILILYNGEVVNFQNTSMVLKLITIKRITLFCLTVQHTQFLISGQEIACIKEKYDYTKTGGRFYQKIPRRLNKLFSRINYWLPAEIYKLDKRFLQTLSVRNGDFIYAGDPILQNIYPRLSGIIFMNMKKRELIIKPSLRYKCNINTWHLLGRKSRFLHPTELKPLGILCQTWIYMEIIKKDKTFIVLRPVIRYLPLTNQQVLAPRQILSNVRNPKILTQPVTTLVYPNGKEIKQSISTSLYKTSLKIFIKRTHRDLLLEAKFNRVLPKIVGSKYYWLGFYLYMTVRLPMFSMNKDSFLTMVLERKIKDNQYSTKGVIIASLSIYISTIVKVISIESHACNLKLAVQFITTIKYYNFDSNLEEPIIQINQFIKKGEFLTNRQRSPYDGKILKICPTQILILPANPNHRSLTGLRKNQINGSYKVVDRNSKIIYELRDNIDPRKLIIKDVTYGVLEATRVLEARNEENPCIFSPMTGIIQEANYAGRLIRYIIRYSLTESLTNFIIFFELMSQNYTDLIVGIGNQIKASQPLTSGVMDYHRRLSNTFFQNLLHTTPLQACKKSLRSLHFYILHDIITVYIEQKIDTSIKHYEIIVKSMTSKLMICHSGDSMLMPGQVILLKDAELIILSFLTLKRNPPLFRPLILGLSKAGTNTESFLTATSFQRTIQLLTESTIEGRKDWLLGLRENIIMCRLSPVGTGLVGSQINYRIQARKLLVQGQRV